VFCFENIVHDESTDVKNIVPVGEQ